MEIKIRKLTPGLLEDYLRFFETDAHADNPDEDRCYCVCWCSADHRAGMDFSTPEKRRELAVRYVNAGIIDGYLAYLGGRVVGWCNANTKSRCHHCLSWLRNPQMASVGKTDAASEGRVKSVFCFAVAPDMKRHGVATRLLERVCEDAAAEGFDYVEAYPNKKFLSVFADFMGPLELYEKRGFALHEEHEHIFVMRKALKPAAVSLPETFPHA